LKVTSNIYLTPWQFGKWRSRLARGITRKMRVPLLLLFAVIGVVQTGLAQTVKFTSPATYPAGSPFVVSAGDFNGDGKTDLVAGDFTNNDLVVLSGNGDGTLKPPVKYHLSSHPRYLLPADFNRDGKLDLAFADGSPSNISVLLGKGDGSFEPPVNYPVAGVLPLTADFNNDGKPDLATRATTTSIALLLNNGNGTFQNAQSYAVPQPLVRVFTAGDFNGDGKIDLFACGVSTGSDLTTRFISVFLGKGDGTFESPINANGNWGQGSGPYSISVGDFDRNGKLDVAVSDEWLTILRGNGDGTFKTPGPRVHLNNTSADLKAGDFNGDGKLDLVTSGVFASGALQVLLGNGDGTFQNLGDQISGRSSVSVVVTDLNGDTRPDLAGNIDGQLAVALVNVTPGNPDNTDYFVHQHYADFLAREPDAGGFDFWANQIASCGADPQCVEVRRINTSASFYLSIEFGETAYLVERLYKTAYGDFIGTSNDGGAAHQLAVPIVRLNELLPDAGQINQDVVVLRTGWQNVLETNKQSFVSQFVQRARFVAALPRSTTPTAFVDKLNQNAGNVLSSSERTTLIGLFANAVDTSSDPIRAQVVRQIAENRSLYDAEFNRAFVLMQYVGYMRRNPDDAPELTRDYTGYDFWLKKLNRFNGNYVEAEMVKAFITSIEYRQRFVQ
jgi:VCBS repeat protein